ncbi:hypothetical protein BM221_008542 [Beauveria bassiana]|uniref:Uncharacterized protein n=1 Tax=Beauveria bassiana TaxID=176275 RepID=A0A2N6ND58_BEABA|nr:hypothetical protein BM221_008542 [Beauveria bassiana]
MADRDHLNDLSCDDVTDAQNSDSSVSDNDSQSATYPQHGGLRPAGGLPAFVPFAAWKPARSYQNTQTLRYNVEWKLFVKNRERAGQSELDIVLSPREFWKHVLRSKLKEESEDKPWQAAAALFVLSVNDRRTKSIKKRYQSQSKIEWPFLAQTLQEWSAPVTPDMVFPTSPLYTFDMPSEDTVAAYSVYQRSQYKGDEQKSYIDLVQDMTIVNGYTLDMIACNQGKMCRFYEKHGIPQGIAWNYVCKIPWFVKMQARSRNMG